MNNKEFSTGVMIVLFAGAIGWSISTLIEVDKRTAIMAEKVSENHKMITPLWEDFIRRKKDGYVEGLDEQTDKKLSLKWK
jgi:hypothetical protein|tara:strand:+ start:465 stop:704 length:240 start_codon:yes stop_codon:yes gene_type:complete